ncbi:MAG: chromate transporter [Chloroflexota bacterium]
MSNIFNEILGELFVRWLVIGALAFGGGQAALSLVARTVVVDSGWLTAPELASAIAFAFMTPGPVLILAPFVGFRVAGVLGGIAAAAGVFAIPWLLAAGSAHLLQWASRNWWVSAFGRGAAPAVVALLALSAIDLGRSSLSGWLHLVIAALAFVGIARRFHPALVLFGGAALGLAEPFVSP